MHDEETPQNLTPEQLELLAERADRPRASATLGKSTLQDPRAKAIYDTLVARRAEHQIERSLEPVAGVLNYLGDPQNLYHSIHITGTNGKTSIARMVESLASTLGYRTGRFTSPHLVDVRERIVVDLEPIAVDAFVRAYEDIEAQLALWENAHPGYRLSFFEVLTVMALAYFADAPVDLAVVEVGMGGRWDSTNVINSDTQVIGPISLEHENWLGRGIENIAREKAGIIKPGSTVVVSSQPEAARQIIEAAAYAQDATLRLEGRDFEVLRRLPAVGGQLIDVRTPAATYHDIFLPLFGAHQAQNAALALSAVEAQVGGQALHADSVARAFAEVQSPGRLEVLHSSPMIVADAGHNPGAAQALAQAVEEDLRWSHVVGIYSAMSDKDMETVLGIMEPVLDEVVVTPMPGERAASLEDLEKVALEVFGEGRVISKDSLVEAIAEASARDDALNQPGGTTGVLVFGSVVLAGMAQEVLGRRP